MMSIIPEAFCDQKYHRISSQSSMESQSSSETNPQVPKEKTIVDSTNSTKLNQFFLRFEEWEKIKPQFGCQKLHPEWTNILCKRIEAFNPLCVLKFSYHRINRKSNN